MSREVKITTRAASNGAAVRTTDRTRSTSSRVRGPSEARPALGTAAVRVNATARTARTARKGPR